jgi:hypothetical protein
LTSTTALTLLGSATSCHSPPWPCTSSLSRWLMGALQQNQPLAQL